MGRRTGGFCACALRASRVFRVRGAPADVSLAAEIIREAVALYNALCEGKRRGEFVRRAQRVSRGRDEADRMRDHQEVRYHVRWQQEGRGAPRRG